MPDNSLEIPAQSSSDSNPNNAELAVNSPTSGSDSAKSNISPKTNGQMKGELKQAVHNVRIAAVYLSFVVGVLIMCYACCVYLNNTNGTTRLEHIYAAAEYLKLHGLPSTIVGLLVWAFAKK